MTDESRLREMAYQIWQAEGKPLGQHDRHWEMARKLVEAECPPPRAPAGNPIRLRPSMAQAVPTTTDGPVAPIARKRRRAGDMDTRPAG